MANKVGTTVTCDDCTETEVWTNAIQNLAVDGDTVVLPAGTGTWSSQHILTKAITLQGAGMDDTIIFNNWSGTFWIRFDLVVGKVSQMTGIWFKNGSSTGAGSIDANGVFRFLGSSTGAYQLRVHHCRFTELHQWPIFASQVRGVFDHNEFIRCLGGCAYVYALNWQSDPPSSPTPGFGDGSWAFPTDAGGADTGEANATYFENNLLTQDGVAYTDGVTTNNSPTVTAASGHFNTAYHLHRLITGTNIPALTYIGIVNSATSIGLSSSETINTPRNATGSGTGIALTIRPPDKTFFDGTRGGRLVVRHNTITQRSGNNAAIITCHGLEGRSRSIRHCEFYNNNITAAGTTILTKNRGGTLVVFNNRAPSTVTGSNFQMDREGDGPGGWGRASGKSPCDVNDTSAGGENDNPTPFYTGVMGATTTTDFIKVSPSPGWSTNQWKGYAVSDLDLIWTPTSDYNQDIPAYVGGTILSNTSDSITTVSSTFGNPHLYAQGHDFCIWRCIQAMDQIGRAGTSDDNLVTGGGVTNNPPVFPTGWNNQVTEPAYCWNNLGGGSDINFIAPSLPNLREGEHYINNVIMPGYPWTDDVSTVCGAEDYTNVTLTGLETRGGRGGFDYPHPLLGEAAPSSILLSGDMSFGNVIIGQTPTSVLTVTNTGDTGQDDIIISSVSYPTGFSGAATGFTLEPGEFQDITVTFTPLLAQLYSGNITVDSDAALGTETIAASGTGVIESGGGGGGHGKGHKKGALSRRA